jgi:carboxyl-terminal processing protease
MNYKYLWVLFCCLIGFQLEATKLPDLTPQEVTAKLHEIMAAHASHKKLTPVLAQRILNNYLDSLDPNKTYFIETDIDPWLHPTDDSLNQVIQNMELSQFTVFQEIQEAFAKAILRRRKIEQTIDYSQLPKHVRSEEFVDMPWAHTEEELITRLKRIRALQLETAAKLNPELKELTLQRIKKRQAMYEEEMLNINPQERNKIILVNVLKATASSLDSHTAYFTPAEASQFMIGVQQRLFGIGAQLRDDISGFTIVKIVEGGPAALSKQLKEKDRIIAVNGEPVVGMDIIDAVSLIRGEKKTSAILTIIRESTTPDGKKKEETLDITIERDEVVLTETRFKTTYEPFGDGIIANLRLYSFYQDQNSSSATDLAKEIDKLKKDHNLLGVILDLRYNSGGLLTQAVAVTGLFITKGIVVSIKDEDGHVQHLRQLESNMVWDGPLIVLENRMSASASEIVAQTLQDYGRALIIGDDHTFGKGSYQTFTLTSGEDEHINPKGEYKVTRGRYYTVSGKTPQLTGVLANIIVPGPLSESEVGESFAKFPLENDHIKSNFEDDLSDIPFLQRDKIKRLYKFGLQEKLDTYTPYLEKLKDNSSIRIEEDPDYQNYIKEIKKKEKADPENQEKFGQNDIQLEEAYRIMKDLLIMLQEKGLLDRPRKELTLFDPS